MKFLTKNERDALDTVQNKHATKTWEYSHKENQNSITPQIDKVIEFQFTFGCSGAAAAASASAEKKRKPKKYLSEN